MEAEDNQTSKTVSVLADSGYGGTCQSKRYANNSLSIFFFLFARATAATVLRTADSTASPCDFYLTIRLSNFVPLETTLGCF
jgi:hypothetical protein